MGDAHFLAAPVRRPAAQHDAVVGILEGLTRTLRGVLGELHQRGRLGHGARGAESAAAACRGQLRGQRVFARGHGAAAGLGQQLGLRLRARVANEQGQGLDPAVERDGRPVGVFARRIRTFLRPAEPLCPVALPHVLVHVCEQQQQNQEG